jgi:diguanylate cyclase (GGDEF)-like protein/PAS domain S-box-containing protein
MKISLRILHLEDNPIDAELVQSIMEKEGIECNMLRVETREDFINALEQDKFDLILADYTLPLFDGLSALKICKEKHPDIPFIFVTGTLGEEIAIETLKAGATDYVVKDKLSRFIPSVKRALQEAEEKSERKRAENERRESSRKLNALIDNLPGVVYRCANDEHWTMEYFSEGVLELTGYPAEEFIGNRIRSFASIIEPEDHLKIIDDVQNALYEMSPYTLEYRILTASGNQKWVWERGSGVFDGDKLLALEGFITDITERKMMEARIEYLAYYDSLTGLPNRNLFIDRLTQGIARGEYGNKIVAVLSIDIDRFKSINDAGIDTGDAVLKEVAGRLMESVRDGDTVSRLGNDNFGVLLIDIAQSKDIILIVEKMMKSASQPIHFNGNEIVITLSVGISTYPADGNDASSLMKKADLAFAKAKQQGRKTYQFYTEGLDVKASEFVLMEKNLFNAIKNEEFILYYQPYWDIYTKKIAGMEALIRWKSPELGLVSPGKFIPILEDTRMIIEVGEWILRTALKKVKEWQNKGHSVVPVSVNLSLIQFRQKDLAEMVKKTMGECGFYPSLLTLEITESAFMQDIDSASSVLKKLKDLGISISIDDFGTGYSSLAYLKRFPIDNLKIDISFIRELATDPDTASIVTAIIAMAHTLNLKTIAEGIETEEQWKILRLLRCDMGQGYYVSRPLPAAEAENIFEQ